MLSSECEILVLHGEICRHQVTSDDLSQSIGQGAQFQGDRLVQLICLDLVSNVRFTNTLSALRALIAVVPIIRATWAAGTRSPTRSTPAIRGRRSTRPTAALTTGRPAIIRASVVSAIISAI
jgi:hypothetical protein